MNKAFFLVLVLFTLLSSIEIVGQSEYSDGQKTQLEVVLRRYPFPTDESALLPQFVELYKNYLFINVPARDSLWLIVDSYAEPYSALDSATYLCFKGFEHYFTHHYQDAIPYFTRSKFIFEKEGDWIAYLEVKRNLANIAYFNKLVLKAFEEYEEIYNHPDATNYHKSRMLHNMASLLMEIEIDDYRGEPGPRKDSIINLISNQLNRAIEFTDTDDALTIASTYSILIDVMLEKRDLDSALIYVDKSYLLAQSIKDEGRIAFVNIKKASLLDSLKRYDEALDVIDEAITYFESVNQYDQLNHALIKKAEIFRAKGNHKEAYNLLIRGNSLVQSYMSDEHAESLAKYETQYETASKELMIKDQEIIIATRTRWMIILAAGLTLLALMFITLRQQQKRKAQAEKDALIIKSKQESLNAVINAQEEERKRIAKDLHDGIVQQLGGLKLGFQKVFKTVTSPDSDRLLQILDSSANELRELSHKMMPKALSDFGLVPALKDMLENSLGHSDISYNFESFGMEKRIDGNKEIALYRIAQELVNNVIKHSAASEVQIQLIRNKKNVMLIVEDNGKGINQVQNKKGIGLMNINSRLDSVNGNVNFEPSPNSGTLVTIKIPLT